MAIRYEKQAENCLGVAWLAAVVTSLPESATPPRLNVSPMEPALRVLRGSLHFVPGSCVPFVVRVVRRRRLAGDPGTLRRRYSGDGTDA